MAVAIALAVSITLNVCQAVVFWLVMFGNNYIWHGRFTKWLPKQKIFEGK